LAEVVNYVLIMRRMMLIVAIFVVMLGLPGFASAGTLLLFDDFEDYEPGSDGFPLWITHSGSWTVTEEGFQGTDCEGHFIAAGASTGRKEWSDYTLSLKLKVISRGSDWRDGPWIGFRHGDDDNVYTLGFYDRLSALHKISKGIATDGETAMTQSNITIKDGKWHNVRITALDTMIAVMLDGNVVMRVQDNDWNDSPPVLSGGIILSARKYGGSTGKTQVVFRDVRVEAVGEGYEDMKLTREDAERMTGANIRLLDFLKTRRERRWTRVPRKVMAFYYTWYGRPENHGNWFQWHDVKPDEHDIASSTHYPARGAYDSHDPETIDYHIQLAKDHGVDAFICTWWGQGHFVDRAFTRVLDRAKEKDFEVTIYWEDAPDEGWKKVSQAVDDLVYVLEKYGSHPAFLKIDGKPVIFVYGRVMGQISMDEWPRVISLAQQRYGEDFILIADGYKEGYARLFDGIHTYNIAGWVQGKKPDKLRELSSGSFTKAVQIARNNAKISCITIIPGYDDTKIRTPGLNTERMDGETYRILWEQAIDANPDWVLITSWNEWHEGSEIEPSWEHGDKYIRITGEYAERFKKIKYSKVPEPSPGIAPERAQTLQKLYKDRTIAILPGFSSDAVFWLLDTGIALKEFTWQDVLDPDKLNVKDFPVLLYASGENYTQTLREKEDIDQAILDYLSRGGLLMALPALPLPFYYNEAGKVVSSARKLGFPIGGIGGWERPPPDVKLTFEINNDLLPGLPSSAAFPETGDLRWRPSLGDDLPEGDVYLPLARLKDEEGRDYGDGIVYVEHRVSAPENGKNIYAWMRMPDVFNTEDVLYELFRLAGEKMTSVDEY
jgi:glycoprotein endo-alpha-1,2-mannosidase